MPVGQPIMLTFTRAVKISDYLVISDAGSMPGILTDTQNLLLIEQEFLVRFVIRFCR